MKKTSFFSLYQNYLVGSIVFIYLLTMFSYVVIVQRTALFDDAFITYRYARNLAEGNGLVWNVGQKPTEGYTNFLLVLILAPFIKMGFDPFLVTRILNGIAIIGTAALLFFTARDCFGMDNLPAFLASLIMFHPLSAYVGMLGLETCLYTFGLTAVLVSFHYFISQQDKKYLKYFAIASLLTFWLRPEAMILIFLCLVTLGLTWRSLNVPEVFKTLAVTLFSPLVVYAIWKYWYYGDLLPNPFYSKVGGSFFSRLGVISVNNYFIVMRGLLPLVVISYLFNDRNKTTRVLTTVFVLVYVGFYLRVDTLMDIYGRFLYPLTPMLAILSFPVFQYLFGDLMKRSSNVFYKLIIVLLLFTVIVGHKNRSFFVFSLSKEEIARGPLMQPGVGRLFGLMIKEYELAKKLALFPKIKQTTIAIQDAGIIPYYTQAKVLDMIGLNDSFIAREKNTIKLLNYFFAQKPDLAFLPTDSENKRWQMFKSNHLADYNILAKDSRWQAYFYCGTVDVYKYNFHLFVRKKYPYAQELQRFLKNKIIDYVLEPFPFPVGYKKY